MDIGISIPSYIDAWREVQAAEEAGFTHAWFFDSQLIYSDVYATMALAAQNTERIRLGTLVAIPTNRIAPVTASAIATINKLAPGRVTLALGTGYTGRNTMGLPAVPVDYFKQYALDVKGLLAGENVLFREGDRERWIRLMHPDRDSFINIHDPIPVFMAANGPKALQAVGEIADGWVTIGAGRNLDADRDAVAPSRPSRWPWRLQPLHSGQHCRLRPLRRRVHELRPRHGPCSPELGDAGPRTMGGRLWARLQPRPVGHHRNGHRI